MTGRNDDRIISCFVGSEVLRLLSEVVPGLPRDVASTLSRDGLLVVSAASVSSLHLSAQCYSYGSGVLRRSRRVGLAAVSIPGYYY